MLFWQVLCPSREISNIHGIDQTGERERGRGGRCGGRRRESGAQIPSAVGHAIVFPNCTFPIASVWNSFSLFSSPLWFSLPTHHHSPLPSFLPPPLYFVFLFFLSFSFFFLFLSFPPSFPLPVFPSVVNPQGLRGIWALRICGVPCRSGIRLVRYAASSRTPRRIRRIRYFALFPPIFAPLSQGTVSNSLWSSQHLSRYRVDSPGTFPFLRSFRFVSSSSLLFFFSSLSLSSRFHFVPCCAHSIGLGKINREDFFHFERFRSDPQRNQSWFLTLFEILIIERFHLVPRENFWPTDNRLVIGFEGKRWEVEFVKINRCSWGIIMD